MTILDWWRLSYAIVAAVIFVVVLIEFKRMLPGMERHQLYWALAILGFILSSVISSLESMYFDDHISIRTPLYMACSFWCALGLIQRRRNDKDEKDGPHGI